MKEPTTDDRRVRRTKSLLHRALASLLHEKSWDDIAVKEILGRADVGRSTFYAHYRDKDALLSAALRETVGVAATPTPQASSGDIVQRVLSFSLPLFEHVERARREHQFSVSTKRFAPLHNRLEPALVDLISEELGRAVSERGVHAGPLPLDLVARQLASTFMVTLEWWIGSAEPRSAREADEIYRSLVESSLLQFCNHSERNATHGST